MTRKMITIRNIAVLALLVEIVVAIVLYFILSSQTMFILSIYILVKNIIVFGAILYVSYVSEGDALSVSDVLNEDSKNAFVFGGIALVQYDSNRNVTWVSDLLLALNVNVVGVKLLEWQPTLASLFDEDDAIKVIDIKGRKFEAYNNSQTRLIYLKDVTQFMTLQTDYEDQQMVMGYITIDNYQETLESVDEHKAVEIQATSRKVIVDWAYNSGMIVRRYKSDGFLIFFNERIYAKQVENKFDILDIFKKALLEYDEVMTLSIGIGRGTTVLGELEQRATQALRLSYSRGGDQVAIKSGKDKVRYFGGKTDAFETSSKVRARVIAQTLAGLIRRSSRVFIMGHKRSDLDSLGSSIGMARIVQGYEKPVNVIIDYNSLEEKTENVVHIMNGMDEYKNLLTSYTEVMDRIDKDTLLIVVDNHKPSLAISSVLLEKIKNKVIIDHHRRSEEFIHAPILTYLEASASSAVELVVELMNYQNVDVHVSEMDATVMYTGMLVDTNNFKQRVGVRTFQAAASLKDMQADVVRSYELLEDSFERTQEILSLTNKAYKYKNDILISVGKNDKDYEQVVLAKVSNQLLTVLDIKAAFTVGRINRNTVAISARSTTDINVQMIMENLGGGGHFSMAACQLKDISIDEAKEKLENAINDYLENRGD